MNAQRIINFTLNGHVVTASVAPYHNLIELLQAQFGLTGARESCGQGLCGCCTVLVNGRAVSGCLFLASFVDGADVTTIEGFDASNQLTAEQEAFIETGAFQCGYCTSGFIIMAKQLLDQNPEPTENQIKHYLTGNLCRCAAYPEIIEAVKLAARKRKAGDATAARP
jgi:aerobic carbon-monoxide dehydrogenase small subunit